MKVTTQLRQMLCSTELDFLMEAHDGLSAKIVAEAGFKGIWGSGLAISAAAGVRDSNELAWTEVLEICDRITDASGLPVLLDADTGYGNFNNVRRLVKKAEQVGIAGICIEDKLFPKTNSFIRGESQALATIQEVVGKTQAAKDTQHDDDFNVVIRTEAFIAGHGLKEALRRADAYRLAGADAVLIHSKIATSADIDAFMAEWGGRHPVVIVPTTYAPATPTDHFRDLGVNLAIWANHTLRASISAMQAATAQIHREQSITGLGDIASVKEIFRLQDAQELLEAETRYLPRYNRPNNRGEPEAV